MFHDMDADHFVKFVIREGIGETPEVVYYISPCQRIYVQANGTGRLALSATDINTGIARIKLGRVILRQYRYAEAETETRAGYDILVKQMDPKVTWLVSARKDLVEEYEALKQPEQAAKFRAEIAATDANPPEVSAKK